MPQTNTQPGTASWTRGLPPGKYYPGMEDDFEVYFPAGGWPGWRRKADYATSIAPDGGRP